MCAAACKPAVEPHGPARGGHAWPSQAPATSASPAHSRKHPASAAGTATARQGALQKAPTHLCQHLGSSQQLSSTSVGQHQRQRPCSKPLLPAGVDLPQCQQLSQAWDHAILPDDPHALGHPSWHIPQGISQPPGAAITGQGTAPCSANQIEPAPTLARCSASAWCHTLDHLRNVCSSPGSWRNTACTKPPRTGAQPMPPPEMSQCQ